MKTPEVIYFEGLPYSGKTTLTRQIAAEYPGVLMSVDEYIHPALNIEANLGYQGFFMENDELKYQVARACGKQCLVDRGHLSTVLYTHAYNEIRGDRDLSYVDNWYFGKILKHQMLPDLYILLDVSAEKSLSRRTSSLDWSNMWDHLEALNFARENYPRYMGIYEPSVPVLTLSSNSMTLEELKKEIVAFLGLNIDYHGFAGL